MLQREKQHWLICPSVNVHMHLQNPVKTMSKYYTTWSVDHRKQTKKEKNSIILVIVENCTTKATGTVLGKEEEENYKWGWGVPFSDHFG